MIFWLVICYIKAIPVGRNAAKLTGLIGDEPLSPRSRSYLHMAEALEEAAPLKFSCFTYETKRSCRSWVQKS